MPTNSTLNIIEYVIGIDSKKRCMLPRKHVLNTFQQLSVFILRDVIVHSVPMENHQETMNALFDNKNGNCFGKGESRKCTASLSVSLLASRQSISTLFQQSKTIRQSLFKLLVIISLKHPPCVVKYNHFSFNKTGFVPVVVVCA